jgi:hypothetical protein
MRIPKVRGGAKVPAVVFMGDSITQRWNVRSYDKSPFVNVGVTGEDTGRMLASRPWRN